MPAPGVPLERLGFLTIGLFDPADPAGGHETTLRTVELGERLGFDSAWLRHRHLQYGISSPVAVLAALTQRASRIELGTAVTPLGWENPLRLAEDLATVDVLSGGRLNPGVSVGPRCTGTTSRARSTPTPPTPRTSPTRAWSDCCAWWPASPRRRSPGARASSRSGRTGCSRTPPACATGSGTAAAAPARRSGPATPACTS
nr:LLM class flavin-dependent oxidoreductase [Geodermatophilus normandii]